MINLSVQQLEDIIAHAVDLGMQMHEADLDPLSDKLTKSQARKYIVRRGYTPSTLQHWEDEGLLQGELSGFSHSSPVYYSLADIKKLICAIKVKKAILDNK